MVEHVGKKRRKEVQRAASMQAQLRSITFSIVVLAALLVFALAATGVLAARGLLEVDSAILQASRLALLVLLIACLVNRALRWRALNEKCRRHCAEFNITQAEIAALKTEGTQGAQSTQGTQGTHN